MKRDLHTTHLVALAIVIAAALTQPVFGSLEHKLIYTENSSTDLTATYDGNSLSVQNTGLDAWNVAVPNGVSFGISDNSLGFFQIAEPENPSHVPTGGWNFVNLAPFSHAVRSDQNFTDIDAIPLSNNTPFIVGVDTRDGAAVSFTFNDVSDGAVTTPDTGSTLGLLAITLAGLFGATCFRFRRAA